uniref:Protein PHLOEM PROTEIN 2-LIKE A1 n=1 Tax=Solanum tuberosum TaxID=4113 RepID=M1C9B8_SOLTU
MGQSLCCNNYLCTKSASVDNNTNVQISYTNDLNDLPHRCSEILKDASMDVHTYCKDKLYDILYQGIVFSDGKTKYWVDKETGKNCFMLFAKNLTIIDQMDHRKWTWQRSKEHRKPGSASNASLIQLEHSESIGKPPCISEDSFICFLVFQMLG